MVDDEPDILKIIKFRLIKLGFEVLFANNGQEGIEMAKTQKPDVILMDYRMPRLDGLEASKRLKEDPELSKIPIIFMTASSASIDRELLTSIKIEDYISKPFDAGDLIEKVEKFLK